MKKYRSTRGMKSSMRDRATLHKNHLEEFKEWIQGRDGWEIQPPTGHPHEVLYVIKNSRSGTEAWSFVYYRLGTDHLTVQADLVPYIAPFLKERKNKRGRPSF